MNMSAELKSVIASLVAVLIGFFQIIGLDNLAHNLEIYVNSQQEQE